MDSRCDWRLPTPAGSEGFALSTHSLHNATAYSQQMASTMPGSVQAQLLPRTQSAVTVSTLVRDDILEPIDTGELAISSLPSHPRSAAHISPFSLSSGDPIGALVSHYASSFSPVPRQSAMSVPASLLGTNYVRPSLSTLINPSSKPGLTTSQLVPTEGREGANSSASLGGLRLPTVGVENVTYRYRSNFSTLKRAQNDGDGRFGPRRIPYTTPARLQYLPEENAVIHPEIGAAWHGYGPAQPADEIGSMVGSFARLYVPDVERYVDPAGIPLPRPRKTPYTSPPQYSSRPLPQPPIMGPPTIPRQPSRPLVVPDLQPRPQSMVPPPVIQQPQPFRPFAVPEPSHPPPSRPISRTLTVRTSLIGSPAAQSGPQMSRPSSVTSWRRISRPSSVIGIPQAYPAQAPVQEPHVTEHQYAPQYRQPTVHYPPLPLQYLRGDEGPAQTSLTIVATTGVPNIKDIPELTGRDRFPVWSIRIIGELKRLGLYKHIAELLPGSELDYVPGEQPTYPPNPITVHASDDAKEYVGTWYGNDGLCLYVITVKLTPGILAEIPKRDELREGRPACAQTVWNYLRDEFGGGDANAVMVAWDKVKTTKATTDQEVGDMISKWESAYNEMVLIDRKPPLDTILSALTVALPHTVLFMPLKYDFADHVRRRDLKEITATSVFSEIKSALRLVADTTSSSKSRSRNSRNDRGLSGTSGSGGAQEKDTCGNCKRTGHAQEKCWVPGGPLHGKDSQIQKVLDERKAAKSGKSTSGTASVNIAPPMAKIEEVEDSGGGGSTLAGVVFADLPDYPEYDSYDTYLACVNLSSRPSWLPPHLDHLLDSGCSRHIFNDKALFWNYRDLPSSSMSTANCGQLDIVGCGTVRLVVTRDDGRPFLINLKDCRYAPDAALNLISVGVWQSAGIAVNLAPYASSRRSVSPSMSTVIV